MSVFSSFPDLYRSVIESLNSGIEIDQVKFSNDITIGVKVKGSSWDGYADVRIAQFIIDLQNAVGKLYEESLDIYNEELIKEIKVNVLVKVRISEGCSEVVWKNAKEILDRIFKGMSGNQKVVVITTAILVLAGHFSFKTWNDSREKILTQIQNESTKQELIHSLDRHSDLIFDMEKHYRGLINKLGEGDTVVLSQQDTEMTRKEATNIYPRQPRLDVKTDYIDGRYSIAQIKFDEGQVLFVLEDDGDRQLKAIVNLSSEETDKLYEELAPRHQNGEKPVMDFQITVKYTKRSIRQATVVGLGAPRPKSIMLSSLFE